MQTIQATVSPKIIDKVDRIFTNRLPSIFVELLQNSRRAGATRVEVTATEQNEKTTITVADNGCGIENFSFLLALGDNETWSQDVQKREDPAGMGFFSLLHSGVTVASKGKVATITKEAFLGHELVEVEESAGDFPGTRLTFVRNENLKDVRSALKSVTEFGVTPVLFNGEEIVRRDFLRNAVYIKEANGVRIGVFIGNSDVLACNFYGSVIALPHNRKLTLRHCLPSGESLYVNFDVREATALRLQLPDRSTIVEDNGYLDLVSVARVALFEFLALQDRHIASYKKYKEAHNLGIQLKEASPFLTEFFVDKLDGPDREIFVKGGEPAPSFINPQECAFVDLDSSHDDICAFTFDVACNFFQNASLKPLEMDMTYEGYSWYDNMPRYTNFRLLIDAVPIEEHSHPVLRVVDSIELTFDVVTTSKIENTRWALPFACFRNEDGGSEPVLFVTHSSNWVTKEEEPKFSLLSAAYHVAFSYDHDYDSDSRETEEDNFLDRISSEIAEALGGKKALAEFQIKKALNWELMGALNAAEVREVRLIKGANGAWEFSIAA